MDELISVISKNTGINKASLRLYTLTNDPSINPDDYYFIDLNQYAGYATKIGSKEQYVFTIDDKGYRDLLLFSDKP